MQIDIINDSTGESLGEFTSRHFVDIPKENDTLIIKNKNYVVNARVHEQLNQSGFSNINRFKLILYVEVKRRENI